MRIEDRLQHLPDGFGGDADPGASFEEVVAAGRRKRAWRAAGAAAGALAVVGVAVAVLGTAATPAPRIRPVGPGPVPPSSASPSSDQADASPEPSPAPQASTAVSPAPEQESPGPQPSDEPVVDDFPPPQPLELHVRTDADEYETGEPVTITIEACNTSSEVHEEYFFEQGHRYTVRILTEDRRAIADTTGRSYPEQDATEVWAPGECRSWTEVWDQNEGRFDDDGGAPAEPGDHTVQLDWNGVPPPPPGTDPELYDPAGRSGAAEHPFTIVRRALLPTDGA